MIFIILCDISFPESDEITAFMFMPCSVVTTSCLFSTLYVPDSTTLPSRPGSLKAEDFLIS